MAEFILVTCDTCKTEAKLPALPEDYYTRIMGVRPNGWIHLQLNGYNRKLFCSIACGVEWLDNQQIDA
jgi:hypothetical protein